MADQSALFTSLTAEIGGPMTRDDCRAAIGRSATWLYVPPGGYAQVHPVSVKILRVGAVKVRVRAPLIGGGSKEVSVLPAKLRLKARGGNG